MKRIVFISFLTVLCIAGCQKNRNADEGKMPEWAKSTIDSISTIEEYEGTILYRYTWNNEYVYHFEIPISTCTYCQLFNQSGIKVVFASESQFQDFLNKKTETEVLWEWNKKL
jgi:hypothetical protein